MNPIQKLNQHPKRNTIVLLVGLIIVIGSAFVFKFLTPKNVVKTNIPAPKFASVKQLSFAGATIDTTTLDQTAINAQPANGLLTQATTLVIQKEIFLNQFNQVTQVTPSVWSEGNDARTLVLDEGTHRFTYQDKTFAGDFDGATVKTIDKTQATTAAIAYVKDILHLSGLVPSLDNISLFTKGQEADGQPIDPSQQNTAAAIPFTYLINGLPSYSELDHTFPLIVYVDSVDKVFSVNVAQTLFTPQSSQPLALLSLQAALDNLKKTNSNSVIQVLTDETTGFQFNQFSSIKVTAYTLEYRFISASHEIIPAYRVTADAVIATSNKSANVTFLIPASNIVLP